MVWHFTCRWPFSESLLHLCCIAVLIGVWGIVRGKGWWGQFRISAGLWNMMFGGIVCRSSCHLTTISVHAHVQIDALLYVTHLDATFRFSTNSVPSLRTIKICSTVSRSCDGVLLRNRDSPLDIAKESVFVFAECLALGDLVSTIVSSWQ